MNASQRKYAIAALPVAGVLILLAACQPKAVKPPETLPPARPADVSGAIRYRIDSAASEVHVLVYRGGTMARFGHNHVITSKDVTGDLWLHTDLPRSSVALSFPVSTLIVDDAAARATQGEDFAAPVPDDARAGTKVNLLKPEVLDGEHYPNITLQSVAIAGTRTMPSLLMRVTIKNVSRDVTVLANVAEDGSTLRVQGEFVIQQSDFGITPFSVAMGALQVQDRLTIKFNLVAVATSS